MPGRIRHGRRKLRAIHRDTASIEADTASIEADAASIEADVTLIEMSALSTETRHASGHGPCVRKRPVLPQFAMQLLSSTMQLRERQDSQSASGISLMQRLAEQSPPQAPRAPEQPAQFWSDW